MKILLDEQLPVKLKYRFHQLFQTTTVRDMNWLGMKDQQLFLNMQEQHFNVFITNDQNLKFQINPAALTFNFIDLDFFSNRYPDLVTIMPLLNIELLHLEKTNEPKGIYILAGESLQKWKTRI